MPYEVDYKVIQHMSAKLPHLLLGSGEDAWIMPPSQDNLTRAIVGYGQWAIPPLAVYAMTKELVDKIADLEAQLGNHEKPKA